MTPVIGIDLGTTNTVVAVVRDGQAAAIPDETGRTLLPSVVSFHPSGNVLVGRDARERRLVDSANTIYSVKRLIGRSWDSEEVQRARTRFAFSMREGPGQAALVVGRGETYTLPEISAFVLRRAKQVAEAALGERVERAVITVPANFNDLQRAATKVAGRVAGLEVLRILNEPTAAALAYGFGKSTAERIAVYDFGGGTFDVTLLDLSDNVFEVLATAGNTFLGGDDIDLLIAERMATTFLSRHRYDPRSDPQAFERLRAAAEDLKQRLSAEPEVTIGLEDVGHGPAGKGLHLEFRMTRLELESLITPLVDRTFDVCREALSLSRRTARDFDQVLLVGGSTRVPLVRRRVEEFFGREVKASVNPDEVVALGAAIQANALTQAERRRKTLPPLPAAAVARRSAPTAARARQDSAPGAEPPSTQSFGDKPRAPLGSEPLEVLGSAPQPRPDAALGVLGRPADKPRLGTATLDGLGARGKVRTGAGLGLPTSEPADPKPFAEPEITDLPQVASTLVSQADAARRAQQLTPQKGSASSRLQEPDPDETTRSMPGKGKAREESAAFTLGEADLEYLAEKSNPNWQKPSTSSRSIDRSMFAAEDDEPTNARGSKPEFSVEDLEIPKPVPALGGTLPLTPAAARRAPLSGFGHITDPTLAAPPTQPIAPAAPPAMAAPPPLAVPSATRTAVMPVVTAPIADLRSAPGPTETVSAPPAPLLVDVTPLTLSVETVSGYCDPIIDRNSPVPCAESRSFVTASDGQTVVRVRVAQGESKRFDNNTLLGEVELPGLQPAPRGAVQISVTFSLDASGMLNVSATEVASGRATRAVLRLVGLPGPSEIAQMMDRQQQRIA